MFGINPWLSLVMFGINPWLSLVMFGILVAVHTILCHLLCLFLEPPFRIGFDMSEYTVSENDGSLSVSVRVISGVAQAVLLSLTTVDGSATGEYSH
jgi:hypothetical protein